MRRKEIYIYFFLSAGWLVGVAWLFVNRFYAHSSKWVVCPTKHLYGIPCPACGTTRSMAQLLEGNVSVAVYQNPLGIVGFLLLVALPLWVIFDAVTRKKTLLWTWQRVDTIFQQKKIVIPAVLLLLANWVWNIYKHN